MPWAGPRAEGKSAQPHACVQPPGDDRLKLIIVRPLRNRANWANGPFPVYNGQTVHVVNKAHFPHASSKAMTRAQRP